MILKQFFPSPAQNKKKLNGTFPVLWSYKRPGETERMWNLFGTLVLLQ